MTALTAQLPLLHAPAVGLVPLDEDEANDRLVAWEHDLGPCGRPFGIDPWGLELDGRLISVAVGASIVSKHVRDREGRVLRCGEVVELARLCSSPGHRWATRVMLRLWREVAAPRWPYWPVVAAVSYSQNAKHPGNVYRLDGWEKVREDAGFSGGGGAWSRPRYASDATHGAKTLWLWRYRR